MRRLPFLIALILVSAASALAQSPLLPERRPIMSRDVDFFGADLQPLFDTTLQACRQACLSNPRCRAFTFNTRSSACFPKAGVQRVDPYAGAFSARIVETDPSLQIQASRIRETLHFLSDEDFRAAYVQADTLSSRYPTDERSERTLRASVLAARQSNDLVQGIEATGAALAATDAPDLWIELARLHLQQAQVSRERRRQFAQQALSSAINATLRDGGPAMQASALSVMSAALESLGRGRATIPALRLSRTLRPREETRIALDRALKLYGFRVTSTRVDSDASAPRFCMIFSEALAKDKVDYAPFVQTGVNGLAVEADGRQLCVGGVRHGERYRVTLRSGLPAASGETLRDPVQITQYVRDRSPALRFPGRAYVLPDAVEAAIPIVTINLDRVDLSLYRVSDRNLVRSLQGNLPGRSLGDFAERRFAADIATRIWEGTAEVERELNQDVTTRLPLGDVAADLAPGVYVLQAREPDKKGYAAATATQWFVVSDLGLAAMQGDDGLHVVVRSLATAAAREGIDVALISEANAVLGRVKTDERGYARFDAGLVLGSGNDRPALVTVRDGDEDMAFLSLRGPAFDLSDRGVEGRASAGPVDVFLTTDRGAYRAGETVHATALIRDGRARALPDLPLTAVLVRPDGVEYGRRVSPRGKTGGHVFDLALGASVPRGTWRLNVFVDPDAPAVATAPFLVEDFLPERIDAALQPPKDPLRLSDRPRLTVKTRYLYGAPGRDLFVEGQVTLRASSTLDAYPGYRFGREDEQVSPRTAGFGGIRTGADGQAAFPVELPAMDDPARPYRATITARIREANGRPIERRLQVNVSPGAPVLGIRPLSGDSVPEGGEAGFDIIALDADLNRQKARVRVRVNRIETRYQWYRLHGNWNWEPITIRERILSREDVISRDAPLRLNVPTRWGRYEVVVERLDGPYAVSAVRFTSGWHAPADASVTPDTLEAALDKLVYTSGETARFRIVPRSAGIAVVSVLSDRLIDLRMVEVTEGENVIDLPVTDDWGTGVYVAASVLRPGRGGGRQGPNRALGLAYAAMEPGERALKARLEVPAELRPRAPATVKLIVDDAEPGQTHATIAAVDVGILNLTGFASPDPSAHYFGQRRLGIELRDLYGQLIDGTNGAMGRIRSGGDADMQLRRQAPPPVARPVALFEGPVTLDADGTADVTFDLPAFDGTIRFMAVVWGDKGIGQARAEALVRDPIVVTASVPRFLQPGDTTRLRLDVAHAAGPPGDVKIRVEGDGMLTGDAFETPLTATLAARERRTFLLPLRAESEGRAELRIVTSTPGGGPELVKEVAIPIERLDPEISRSAQFALAAGGTFKLDRSVFSGFRPGSGSAILSAGPLARFDAPGLLAALGRFSYGCTEQIVSQTLPLLYYGEMAQRLELSERGDVAMRINQSIDAVLSNQSSNGSFGLWRAGSGDAWLNAYVTDFLGRARAEGFAVPDPAFRMALDQLRNAVNFAPDFEDGGEGLAYALFVLAREGLAAIGDLRYYADVKADAFSTPLALAQLGAALSAYGDPARADALFAKAVRKATLERVPSSQQARRVDYGTALRDAAGILALATEAGRKTFDSSLLSDWIVATPDARRSTQEAAWTLLAANALHGKGRASFPTVNGRRQEEPFLQILAADAEAPRLLRNEDATDASMTLTVFGVPDEPVRAGGKGYAIERSYFTMEGRPVDPGEIAQGTRLVVLLTVTPFERREARLMIDDPLPAGFEIDNPNLLRSGEIAPLEWIGETATAENAEFRQERFLAAVDWREAHPFRLAYIVRAVSVGDYHHAAAAVEDMYRPTFRAHTDAGRVVILP
ncbi:MAG: alpha-2-macroglobulin family protein [Pseudomonadota bacterium]